jgi:micrococcal nuclease
MGLITFAGVVWAAEVLPGPIPAVVTEVVDGDTIGVRARIWLGQQIQMWEIGYGKYAGRITARVTLGNGQDLGADLIHAGLARPYDGGAR